MATPTPQTDPFDTLLTLEDDLYTHAYTLGTQDGSRAGRIEGRVFGLEKGFEKFAALGALHGRSCVWGSRVARGAQSPITTNAKDATDAKQDTRNPKEGGRATIIDDDASGDKALPQLVQNTRLTKHISTLHALTDPPTFATLNTEDDVADFDDRFKRAAAKAKIIERIVGEIEGASLSSADSAAKGKGRGRGVKVVGEGQKDDSMEDFGGSRFLS